MSFVGDKIAALLRPNPEIIDPEDAVNIDSSLTVYPSEVIQDETDETRSSLRHKTAPLLEDVDPTYAGKKVSRQNLGDIFHEDDDSSANDEQDSNARYSSSSNSEDSGSEEDEIDNFKKQVASNTSKIDEKNISSEDNVSSEEDDEDNANDDITEKFSNIDVTSDIEKGTAIQNQKEIWNRLLETRIKLQKLLIIANKLPQAPIWNTLKDKGGKEMNENLKKGCQSVKNIFNSFIDLQSDLEERNTEITNCDNVTNVKANHDSEEEIPSQTDEEDELEEVKLKCEKEKKKTRKRKSEAEYDNILSKRHKDLIPYRNSVIQKWDEKTRLSTGRMTQKSFMAFDNTALKQIEQILQDKLRLIRRTQLKRSLYRILGKTDPESHTMDDLKMKDIDYDSEIFDDDDFYRQILKDVIESKSFGMNSAIIRKQMEIQKIRNKMKRKVDTKASKGRKLRYDIHPKLVNFMAPIQTNTMSDKARGSFFKYLFGGNHGSITPNTL